MNSKTKILLADDHNLFMDALEMMIGLEEDFEVIGKVNNGNQVVDFITTSEPDVLVLDINMPEKDGIDTLNSLKKMNYNGSVIMLSSISDSRMVHDAFKKGAHGYLSKKCARKEISTAIRSVVGGDPYLGSEINKSVVNQLFLKKEGQEAEESAMMKQLSAREIEILKLIAMEYTSKEIAEELFIAQTTVDTHRKNLIEKLKVKNAVGLGKFALKNNLI